MGRPGYHLIIMKPIYFQHNLTTHFTYTTFRGTSPMLLQEKIKMKAAVWHLGIYMFYLYKVRTIAEGPDLFLCCLRSN